MTLLFIVCFGDCIFPEFLYRSKLGATNRKWTSETYFRPGADSWKSQQDILVEASSYTITKQTRIDCYENGKLSTCPQRETLYKRVCQRKEYQDVYRVAHYKNPSVTLSYLPHSSIPNTIFTPRSYLRFTLSLASTIKE